MDKGEASTWPGPSYVLPVDRYSALPHPSHGLPQPHPLPILLVWTHPRSPYSHALPRIQGWQRAHGGSGMSLSGASCSMPTSAEASGADRDHRISSGMRGLAAMQHLGGHLTGGGCAQVRAAWGTPCSPPRPCCRRRAEGLLQTLCVRAGFWFTGLGASLVKSQ